MGIFSEFRPYEVDSMNTFDLILLTNVSVIAGLNVVATGVIESSLRDKLLIWTHIHVYLPLIGLLLHFGHWLYQKMKQRGHPKGKSLANDC